MWPPLCSTDRLFPEDTDGESHRSLKGEVWGAAKTPAWSHWKSLQVIVPFKRILLIIFMLKCKNNQTPNAAFGTPIFCQASVWAHERERRSEKAAVGAETADRWAEEAAFAEEGASLSSTRCSKSAHILSNLAHALCTAGLSGPLSERWVCKIYIFQY